MRAGLGSDVRWKTVRHQIMLPVYDEECLMRSATGSDVDDVTPLGILREI